MFSSLVAWLAQGAAAFRQRLVGSSVFVAYAGAVARVAELSARVRPLVFVLRAGCIGAGAYWFTLGGPLARAGFAARRCGSTTPSPRPSSSPRSRMRSPCAECSTRTPAGRRTAPGRGSPLGLRLRSPPAALGPDRHDGEPGGALASCAERPAAERIGVRLDVRPGELPAPPAHPALVDCAPAGPGAPVALPGRHSHVQPAGISAPKRYRSR